MKKSGKRILSFILTAVMIFVLLPVIGRPMVVKAIPSPQDHAEHEDCDMGALEHKGWKSISDAASLMSIGGKDGYWYLTDNINITEALEIKSGITVHLCLNGFSITQTENFDTIDVYGTLNLYDKKDNSGKITHAYTKIGRGVSIQPNGSFTMNGGTISENNVSYGGGVYNLGTFTMKGGTISGNKANYNGGGVYNSGTFTMNGGTIEGNNAKYGGGVRNNGTFTMTGGTIEGNKADSNGGGAYNDGPFTMNGGTIAGNIANNGGGVYNHKTFTMNGGTIAGNTAPDGGGVYNNGTFTMNGGTIEGNYAPHGGGVDNTSSGIFTMIGGTISGNNADFNGSGVLNYGIFTMTGGTIARNNTIYGGGLYNVGTFTMNEGTIEGNNANYGAGVYNQGSFKMIEGAIKENKASKKGSGVYSFKPFVKEGGEIVDSIESYGSAFCTVTFNANDESDKTIIQYVNPNEDINLEPNKFSYGNYTFDCWNTMADGTGDSYQDKATINIKGDLVLFARWIEKSYEVTFNINNGSWEDGTKDEKTITVLKYVGDKELKLNASDIPTPANPDTGFKGSWDNVPDTVNELTENKTYTYTFEPIEYTVEYDPNGGVGIMLDQARKYDDKKPLTTNAFTLEGYTFKGWNTVADGSGTSYADENVSNLSSTDGDTVTLFAQWQANNYTVKYDPNGGDGRMENQGRTYDDKAPLTANTFTFEGKTFNGWNTAADGSGTHFKDEEVNNLSSTEGDTVTLYAQWTTNTYTVSWKDYDGTVLETDTDVAYGSTPSYDGETPKRDDAGNIKYTFSGWTPAIDTVKGAATYTAIYSENEIIYTVTFDANGGKTDTTTGTTNAEFKLSSLPTPTYEGYKFKGWFTEATGGSEISADTVYTQDTTIYAQWEKVEEPEEPTTPEEPQEPTEPETPEITEPAPEPDPEPEVEIPEKDWLDDLRLALNIAAESDSEKTVEYSGDFALPYEIMNFLVIHPDITFVYHITYEGQEYTITIPAGSAVAYSDTPWYGPLWLLANYGGNNAPTGAKGNGTYVVKAGETLTGISVKLGVTIQYLVDKNGIKNADYIIEGQEINY